MTPSWVRRARRGLGRARDRLRRARLRTRVLAGVLAVTLAALVAFDIAAVTALRGYLLNQTDAKLQSVLALYRPFSAGIRVVTPQQRPRQARLPVHCRGAATAPASPRAIAGCGFAGPRFVLPPALAGFLVGTAAGPASGRGPRLSFLVKGGQDLIPRLPADLRDLAAGHRGQTVTSTDGRNQLRLMAESFPGTGIVYATASLSDLNSTVGQLELILVIGSIAAGLLAAAGTAAVMRRGMRPIETMAAQADKITAGDLTGRVSPHDARTEVGRLGRALNGMLARIQGFVAEREASQRATSRFFADASHELRTPLASLRANAELYQQGALPERAQVDEAMWRITAEARRMGGLVDDMLRLARLDQHPEQQHDRVDLTALAGECTRRARTSHPGYTWHARIAPGLVTTGDEELLRRALDNLLANVAAHAPPGTGATLTAARRDAAISVEVSDDGPGVPGDQLPRIFDRFFRAGAPSPRPGSGLGLAIVAATAAAHHGSVLATPNDPHGLVVTLTLPASPGPPASTGPDEPGDNADAASQVTEIV
jgi:two-component system OmpR family sensor kinase